MNIGKALRSAWDRLLALLGLQRRQVTPAWRMLQDDRALEVYVFVLENPRLKHIVAVRNMKTKVYFDRLVARVFDGYVNHYTANPLLEPDLALEGYVDWVRRTAQANPDSLGVLAHGERSVGVATWFVDPGGEVVEILLAGLVPEARGHGWYAALLAEVGRVATGLDVPRVVISTQAANVAVQRAWVSAGFKPLAAVTTAHAVRRGLLPGSHPAPD